MSHEWNCRCPRCLADEAKYTGPDPREDEREPTGGAREASEGDE